ncbi:MAG TPA: sulfur oxidation c-type cytochrome SoxX [Gammaproteobacteria bacterium]|nr:sulfur oxidation c-type cytochrome SoxX [Gammaproteobacteria bacterium]
MKTVKFQVQVHRLLQAFAAAFLVCAPPAVHAAESGTGAAAQPYFDWVAQDYEIREPLGGLVGDPERGARIASDQHAGNCFACHLLPLDPDEFYGNLGPPLAGIASRQSVGMIRLHVVDQTRFNPETVMPGYYRRFEQLNRVAEKYRGRTYLSAQQIEDVVAWLATLNAEATP